MEYAILTKIDGILVSLNCILILGDFNNMSVTIGFTGRLKMVYLALKVMLVDQVLQADLGLMVHLDCQAFLE